MLIADAFLTSDVFHRLQSLGITISQTLPVGPRSLVVAEYVPKQGALSEWDDETRIVEYRWDGERGFERLQFVSKAGKSIKGRLNALTLFDVDHDGMPEIFAIGFPHGVSSKVMSQVYRRSSADQRFEAIWQRRDFGAAFNLNALTYVTLDPATYRPRSQRLTWRDGKLETQP